MNNEFKQAMDSAINDDPSPMDDRLHHQTETISNTAPLPVTEQRKSEEDVAEAQRKAQSLRPLV